MCSKAKRIKLTGDIDIPEIITPKENIQPVDQDAEKTFELTQLALSSTVFVAALETIPSLRKKCATLGIKGNFDYPQPNPIQRKKMKCKNVRKPFGQYRVECILDHDIVDHLYLIKWVGYDASFNTWEPIDHLSGSGTIDLVSNFRLMERSLSENNKIAFKKLLSLNCLMEELISPANHDPFLLLKLNGKSMSHYKPGDLLPLKKELKSNCKNLQDCVYQKDFSFRYNRELHKILTDLHIIESFHSFERLQEFSMLRKSVFKSLKNWEAKINLTISKEEGCAPIEIENNFDLDLPPDDFSYITKCKPGPDVTIANEPAWFCDCLDGCFTETKMCCPNMNDSKLSYNRHGCLKNQLQSTIFECNSKCKCNSSCPNRVIQKGRKVSIY